MKVVEYIKENCGRFELKVYVFLREIDEMVVRIKFVLMGIKIEEFIEE